MNKGTLLEESRVGDPTQLVTERATASESQLAGESNFGAMFERLLRDDSVTPERLERFMDLYERMEAKRAEMAFNRALAAAQKEMRPVSADAYNPQTRSKYASYEQLDRALRPIYTAHGLSVSFPGTADSPLAEHIRVIAKVTHDDGHAERYHLDMPADGKGAKGGDVMTKTHAVGSALSYGQRYLLKGIFNIAIGSGDDDGNRAAAKQEKPTPKGFDDWWNDLCAVADEGTKALEKAWAASSSDLKTFVIQNRKDAWNGLKAKAAKVKA